MEIRYNMKFQTKNTFVKFIDWAKINNLNWQCGRLITIDDWETVKNRVSIFWFVNDKFIGFETCASVTFNCKDAVRYIQISPVRFLNIMQIKE